jgi:hypothetical protein
MKQIVPRGSHREFLIFGRNPGEPASLSNVITDTRMLSRMTRIQAEQIPNCYFLGKSARLRIYRNEKISVDPTGRNDYLAAPSGWKVLNEYACPIEGGRLTIPEIELEPTVTRSDGLPTMVYMAVLIDESGFERCSVLDLNALMSGYQPVIEGYDQAGVRKLITLTQVSFEKTNQFVSFTRADGQVRYKPKPGVRLEFAKEISCVKQGEAVTLPPIALDFEPDSAGRPTVIFILLEKTRNSKSSRYLGTMHFELDETNPKAAEAFIYTDLGPQEIMVEKDPIPECGYLGKSAILRIYRTSKFSPDPSDSTKYVSVPGSDEHVKDIGCTIKNDTLYIPVFPLEVDRDSEGKPTALFTGMLVDYAGVERGALFSNISIERVGTRQSPVTLKFANAPTPDRNPLKVYRSRDFYHYKSDGKWAYAPKPESLEYVMDIPYEINKDGALVIGSWTIDIDDDEIQQNETATPNVIYRGIIIVSGVERIAFTGYIAGRPARLITTESEQSKVIVKSFKPSPFRTRCRDL